MFLNDKQREYAQLKLKWHKWPNEKPKTMELCRILYGDCQKLIIPIAFLNRYNTWEDYDEFFCVYKDVKYWMYEKEFNIALESCDSNSNDNDDDLWGIRLVRLI